MTKLKIVVIEDQEEVRENLMETLELADYEVHGAADGHEGVQLVREIKPQLILCDVMMPKLDGYGVLELLHKDPSTAHIPLVFLTARTEREDLRRGMNLGAADYVTKPFFQDELLKVVELRIAHAQDLTGQPNQGSSAQAPQSAVAYQSALEGLLSHAKHRRYTERAEIYYEGDSVQRVFHVVSGRVSLYRETDFGKTLTLDFFGSGSWFGIDDLLAGGMHVCGARAFPEAELAIVERAELLSVLERNPGLALSFCRQFAQDLALRSEQLLQVAYFSVRRRVAEFLLRFAAQQASAPIDVRREDIAEAVGTTAESVTRVLTEFKREGLVELPAAGSISVIDPKGLEATPY